MKTFGPSNDEIPEDELYLAKLLQNAGARGWGSTKGSYWVSTTGRKLFALEDDEGRPLADHDIRGCCAVGAAVVEADTLSPGIDESYLVNGNDSDEWNSSVNDFCETVGHAFQLALGEE